MALVPAIGALDDAVSAAAGRHVTVTRCELTGYMRMQGQGRGSEMQRNAIWQVWQSWAATMMFRYRNGFL